MKPSKPSHQLNLQGVKDWATSLSPEAHLQWLDGLLERSSERSKEPYAKEEARRLKLDQDARRLKREGEAQRLKLEEEAQAALEQVAQAALEQCLQSLKLEEEQLAQALTQVLTSRNAR